MQPQPIEYTQPVQYTQPGAIPQPSQYQQPATQYMQPTQPMQQFSQQPAPQMMGAPQQVVYVTQQKKSNDKVPWIAVALIFVSLFLPYITILGEFSYSGFELMGEVGEMMSAIDSEGSGDGDSSEDSADVPTEFVFFGIAMMMVVFSPFVFLISAIISSIVLASGKSAKIMGVLHLGYAIIFLIVAAIGTVDFIGISFSMFDFAGFGFYVGAFASGLLFIE